MTTIKMKEKEMGWNKGQSMTSQKKPNVFTNQVEIYEHEHS